MVDEKSPLKLSDAVKDRHEEMEVSNDYVPAAVLQRERLCGDGVAVNEQLFGWDGMILSAPMVKIKDELKPPAFLVSLGSYLVPLLPDARVVPTKKLWDKLTRDEEYVAFIQKSPLLYDDKPALRTAFVLMGFTEHIEREMDKVRIPMLIMHGAEDRITDPAMSQILFDRCSCRDKEIKIIEGAWHALLLDTCRKEVFDTMDEWITQRIKN